MERQANEGGIPLLDKHIPLATTDATAPPAPGTRETSLRGVWLVVARAAWLLVVLGSLVFFGVSIPTYFAQEQSVCTVVGCIGLAQNDIRGFQALGISLTLYASCVVVFAVLYVLIWSGIAAVLFWRKSADRMALFTGLMLVTFAIIQTDSLTTLPAGLIWFDHLIRVLASICFTLFFYLFPTGQFAPRWTRWLSIAAVAFWVGNEFIANSPDDILFWVDFALFLVILVSLAIVQVYRYRHISGPVQRQQAKWVVFGVALAVGGYLGIILLGLFLPAIRQGAIGDILGNIVFPFILLPVPISIGLAIVRSRLWDIDLIINRALVYGTLTVLLALVYAGLVLGLQALLGGLLHQTNAIALVVSTLVIAALFQPLRLRIQAVIDRRFYRRKYDAARILEAFSAALRNEVDLATLSEHLVAVVEETMQPTHVLLWLRSPAHHGNHRVSWRANPVVHSRDEIRDER